MYSAWRLEAACPLPLQSSRTAAHSVAGSCRHQTQPTKTHNIVIQKVLRVQRKQPPELQLGRTRAEGALAFGSIRMINSPCWLGPDQSGSDSNASAEPVRPIVDQQQTVSSFKLTRSSHFAVGSKCSSKQLLACSCGNLLHTNEHIGCQPMVYTKRIP